jgi:transposase
LSDVSKAREDHAVPQQDTVLYQLLQQVPWKQFAELSADPAHAAEDRGFTPKSHLVALIYAQLIGAASLREIKLGMESQASRLAALDVTPAQRSTLSDANRDRPCSLFIALLLAMISRLNRVQKRHLDESVYLIDASFLALSARQAGWARFCATTCGAKMHVIYDAGEGQPIYAAVSAANVNDITAAQSMPLQPGATYVFDLAYYDYAWWATLDAAQCRLVTRLKSNTPLEVIETRPPPAGAAHIRSDRIGFLPQRQAYSRRNPMAAAVREVTVRISTGTVLRILSNDLDAPATEIAALYKRRWQIELFFRWLKQVLKIRHFYSVSANAVTTQVATALITYLLLQAAHKRHSGPLRRLDFVRLVRINRMLDCPLEALLPPSVPQRGPPIVPQRRPVEAKQR